MAEIEAYIDAAPAVMQDALQKLRQIIKAVAPEAVEGFAYGMPAYKYRGRRLLYFGAAKNHYALYGAIASAIATLSEELEDYDSSKGTLRFPSGEPPPEALVVRLIRIRQAEIDEAEAGRRERKRGRG